jgi:hypothetical protein
MTWRHEMVTTIQGYIAAGACANCGFHDPSDEAGGEAIAEGIRLCHLCAERYTPDRQWRKTILCIAISRCPADVGICADADLRCGRQ